MVPAREDIYMNAEHPYDPPPLWVQGHALHPSVLRLGTRLVGGNQLASPFMGAGPRPAPQRAPPRNKACWWKSISFPLYECRAAPCTSKLSPIVPRKGTRLDVGIQLASPLMGAGPRPAVLA